MAFDRARHHETYPFASHWFAVEGGHQLHYVDEGADRKGRPVLMVHGNPTWSFYFREAIKALRHTRRVIAIDHIGCGLSDKPGDDTYEYVLDRRVDDLLALMTHLQIENDFDLIVHDWGGMIGVTAALRHLDGLGKIVVLNTAAFLSPQLAAGRKSLPFRLWLLRNVSGVAALAVRGANAFAALATRMASHRGLDALTRDGLLAPYDSWKNRIATLRFVQDIPMRAGDRSYATALATDQALSRLANKPMLILWGERDFVFDQDFLAEWRRRFPSARVRAFPDAGHYVLEDARAEVVAEIVAFLGGESAAAPAPARAIEE